MLALSIKAGLFLKDCGPNEIILEAFVDVSQQRIVLNELLIKMDIATWTDCAVLAAFRQ